MGRNGSPLFSIDQCPFDLLEHGGGDVPLVDEQYLQSIAEAARKKYFEDAGDEASITERKELDRIMRSGVKQEMIVLCGLDLDVMSNFSTALQEHCPDYARCHESDHCRRHEAEVCVLHSLHEGLNVVIDHGNLSVTDRLPWLTLACSMPRLEVQAFFFDWPTRLCEQKIAKEADTIDDLNEAHGRLRKKQRQLVRPSHEEGFHRIIDIRPNDFASDIPTRDELDKILQRAEEAPLGGAQPTSGPPVIINSKTGTGVTAGTSWRDRIQQPKQETKSVERVGIRWGNLVL